MTPLVALVCSAVGITLLGISWGVVGSENLRHLADMFHVDRGDEGSEDS